MVSPAQLRANKKYQDANYEQIQFRVPKGEKTLFQEFAKAAGMSLREYIRRACYEKHERK